MITLEAADLIEGDASAASAVDYTINGVEEASSVVSVKALADGQLPSSKGTLYTCPASTTAIIKSIILVNTDSSARTVNLYTQRDGSNSRRIIPENLSLEANGGTAILADQLYVFSASGELLYKVTQDTHILGGSAHSADTLANLNSKISDATLDDSSASRTPTAHKSSHATGGADELYLQDLEHTAADATLHDSLTSTPHVSAAEKTTWNGKIANVVEDTTPQLGGDLDAQTKRIYDVKVLDFKAPTELTIATGAITVTQTFHTVDTEADAASDDLATINGGSDGRLIVIKAVNDARTVVVKHNTGNIWLQGKADISLDDISDGLMLVYSATDSKWFDIAAGGAGGGGLNNVVEDTTPQLGGDLDCQTKRLYDIKLLDLKSPTELTISSGSITITQSQHTVDTEGNAATDDLVTINGGGSAYGRLLFIRPAADTRTIVVKHNTGNIWLKGKADLSLDEIGDGLLLIFTGSGWLDVGAGGGGGGGTKIEDGTSKFEIASTNGPIVGTVAGTEAFRQSTAGILTLAKQPAARAYLGTLQSIPSSDTVFYKLNIDTENFDQQNEFNTGTYRFTAKEAGIYFVVGSVTIQAMATGKRVKVAIYKNGGALILSTSTTTGIPWPQPIASDVCQLAANDYLELWCNQNHGSDRNAHNSGAATFLAVVKLA